MKQTTRFCPGLFSASSGTLQAVRLSLVSRSMSKLAPNEHLYLVKFLIMSVIFFFHRHRPWPVAGDSIRTCVAGFHRQSIWRAGT